MIEFTELSEGLGRLESSLDELLSAHDSSQLEAETHINCARSQLQVLYTQIQELSAQLETKDEENKLLLNELDLALKVRNELASKFATIEDGVIQGKQNETEILIKVNKDLQEEVKVLQLQLQHASKNLKDLDDNHRLAEDVIVNENNNLKDENESLRDDIKSMTQKYNQVKKDFLNNVETLKILKIKLLEQKESIQECECLKSVNLKLASELKLVKEKCEHIQKEFQSYSNTLNAMTKKLSEQNYCLELNKKLIAEKDAIIDDLENNNKCKKIYEEEINYNKKSLQDAFVQIQSKDEEINCLKSQLKSEQEHLAEMSISSKKNLTYFQRKYYEQKKIANDVSYKMIECCNKNKVERDVLEEFQDYLIYSNIRYNIDVDYLKCILLNQENFITELKIQLEESQKPKEQNSKDVEVQAEVITTDMSVVADMEKQGNVVTKDACILTDLEIPVKVVTNDVGVLATDDSAEMMDEMIKEINFENILDKVLEHVDSYKERNQNPSDGKDIDGKKMEDPYLSKILVMIDLKISGLLTEVKEFYERSICDLQKLYKMEAEKQLSFSETSLAKLKYCYEKNLKFLRREHDEKVIRLLASHEEEIKNMSLYQQRVHSIQEKINRGKLKKKK